MVGELIRGETQIEQHAVGRHESLVARHDRKLLEVGLAQRHPVAEIGEPMCGSGDGRPVGIEAEEAAIR
jgi:hypothetical protein